MSVDKDFISIDPTSLPRHFESEEAEARWHTFWQEEGVYDYDSTRSREETFVVDTPPPTVSGSLHIGHVFSYTHTDVSVRYHRMTGKNVFYPMGWDDNGLPTERRVQNFYHVTCDPTLPYEEGLRLEQASSKQRKDPVRAVSRQNFIELCHNLTVEDEEIFKTLWQRLGLSVDWNEQYATIDDHCRRLSQLSFIDLYNKDHVYNRESPTMWDVDFQTAVAQAEAEDRDTAGAYHKIAFGVEGEERTFTIATTRPELLAACVGVTAHPDDVRYKDLFGKRAITPLFRVPVPIFASEKADPEKGTGILMVCTFGDSTDVEWWQQEGLALRQIVGRNGRLLPVTFGEDGWESLDAKAANTFYGRISGNNVKQAQRETVEMLRDESGGVTPGLAALQGEPEPIVHPVRYYEKGDRPLELVSTRQWFVRLMDKKDQLLEKGRQIQWHPSYMGRRFADWTENLQLDWCISRQRFFGVSFPVWYRLDETGEVDYENPILAKPETLPMDPMIETPPGFTEDQRGQPGGFIGEKDIYDTWFTSSLTPQIGSHWTLDTDRHARLFPADVRPQAHDIIRTWAFYTIAKALLHENEVPWHNAVISGWILDPDRKKMSKSKGNVVTPMALLEQYTSDGIRYWSASAKLGTDTALDEGVMKNGRRLVVKIYNAGKFALSFGGREGPITEPIDQAFLRKLQELIGRATRSFEHFESGLAETEDFFWHSFTDTYIELVKERAKSGGASGASAVTTLRTGLHILLRLFAPVLPYITEEVWSWAFAAETGPRSIHVAPWPSDDDFDGMDLADTSIVFDTAITALSEVHKTKTMNGVSLGKEIKTITLTGNAQTMAHLEPAMADVMAAGRAADWNMEIDEDVPAGTVQIARVTFAE